MRTVTPPLAVSLSSAEISLFFSTRTRDLLLHLRMLTAQNNGILAFLLHNYKFKDR